MWHKVKNVARLETAETNVRGVPATSPVERCCNQAAACLAKKNNLSGDMAGGAAVVKTAVIHADGGQMCRCQLSRNACLKNNLVV